MESPRTRGDVRVGGRARPRGTDPVVVVHCIDQIELTVGAVRRQRTPQNVEHVEGVVERELPLEFQQEPAVAEEQAVCVGLTEVLEELRLVVLQQQREMRELRRHGLAVGQEVALEPTHQPAEAHVGVGLVVLDDQQRRRDIAHALAVRDVRMGERERDQQVEERLQIGVVVGAGVERVAAVGPSHVLLHHHRDDPDFVRRVAVQEWFPPLVAQPVVFGRFHPEIFEPHTTIQALWIDVEEMPPDHLAQGRLDAAAVDTQAELFRLAEVTDWVEECVELGIRHGSFHWDRLIRFNWRVL